MKNCVFRNKGGKVHSTLENATKSAEAVNYAQQSVLPPRSNDAQPVVVKEDLNENANSWRLNDQLTGMDQA